MKMKSATLTLDHDQIVLEWPQEAAWVPVTKKVLQAAVDTANVAQKALTLHTDGPDGYCQHCHRPAPCPTARILVGQ